MFFLGGIPTVTGVGTPGCTGFSTNPSDPADATNPAGERIRFYEFQSDRLVDPFSKGFYSYLDTFGVGDGAGGIVRGAPYAYFSSYKGSNNYNRFYRVDGKSDCADLGVWPYAEGAASSGAFPYLRYVKADSYQIISAGKDQIFGPGTPPPPPASTTPGPFWSPGSAVGYGNAFPAAKDDQSNFYSDLLGK